MLRNWVTDEVVDRLTKKDDTGEYPCSCDANNMDIDLFFVARLPDFLAQVLEMACEPFRAWDEDEAPAGMSQSDAKVRLASAQTC